MVDQDRCMMWELTDVTKTAQRENIVYRSITEYLTSSNENKINKAIQNQALLIDFISSPGFKKQKLEP